MEEKEMLEEQIGGADGPVSYFTGTDGAKESKPIKKMKNWVDNKKYQHSRKKQQKKLEANPHTLKEVEDYIIGQLGGQEVSRSSEIYMEKYREYRSSLILQHAPELVGEPLRDQMPENLDNPDILKAWIEKVEEYQERAKQVPEETFPTDYHLYQIWADGIEEMYVEIEHTYDCLSMEYATDARRKSDKAGSSISKEIYLYYGVTEEDIKHHTKRYETLITILAT